RSALEAASGSVKAGAMSAATATLADIQSDFDWDAYLRSLGPKAARVAPASCFKQAANPPSNDFQPGQRLESRDPRNPDNTCIATVVECLGPRLRLRLDGSDDRNDFYRLVDSDDIFPHPTSRFLVPPLGFAKSSNYWPAFLEKVKQTGNFAPRSSFRKPPPAPVKNTFSAGQKLEAVDRKNPLFVCPATVKEVRDRCTSLSTVGAAHSTIGAGSTRTTCSRLAGAAGPLNSSSSTSTPGVGSGGKQSKKKKKKKSRKGSGDSGKTAAAAQQLGGKVGGRKSEAEQKSSATSAMAAATSTAAAAAKAKKELLTAYVNPAAANRQVSRLRRLPGQFGPAPPSRLLQRILQAAVSAAHDGRRVYERVPRAPEDSANGGAKEGRHHHHRSYRVRAKFGHRRHSRALPRVADGREFWRLIGAFLAGLDSEGLFRRRPGKLVGPADSSLLVRYLSKRFIETYQSGIDILYRHRAVLQDSTIDVEILDTSSCETARARARLFLELARTVRDNAAISAGSAKERRLPAVLVGNKTDLAYCGHGNNKAEMEILSSQFRCRHFVTSAAEDPKIIDLIFTGLIAEGHLSIGQSHSLRKASLPGRGQLQQQRHSRPSMLALREEDL
uniref:SLED domain-containing protein n=1 Tax=Macrostomum lignano TaxID=282301 RepID=A0A1I8JNH5_9PLAT